MRKKTKKNKINKAIKKDLCKLNLKCIYKIILLTNPDYYSLTDLLQSSTISFYTTGSFLSTRNFSFQLNHRCNAFILKYPYSTSFKFHGLSRAAQKTLKQYLHSGGLSWIIRLTNSDYCDYSDTYTHLLTKTFQKHVCSKHVKYSCKQEMMRVVTIMLAYHIFVYKLICMWLSK